MSDQPSLDHELAHKFFSANCFNSTWQFIDQPDRTPEDDEKMISSAHASVWHWTQRPDCTDKNMSIGYWLLSRVYALIGNADTSRRYGEMCLKITPTDDAFCMGYAYEALARAELVAGNSEKSKEYADQSREHAATVTDESDKKLLDDDLAALPE